MTLREVGVWDSIVARYRYAVALFLFALFVLGAVLGGLIARHPKLETFKLLNVVGLTLDLLGIAVLSELVTSSKRWQDFVVNILAGTLLWGFTVTPFGAALGAWLAPHFWLAPSSEAAASFFFSFGVAFPFFLAIFEGFVVNPGPKSANDLKGRTAKMGLWLLVVGVLVQLYAAFKDLYP